MTQLKTEGQVPAQNEMILCHLLILVPLGQLKKKKDLSGFYAACNHQISKAILT